MSRNSVQMYTPPLTKVNKVILILAGVLFLLQTVISDIVPLLGLSPLFVTKGLIHQFITYPFAQTGLISAIFSGLIIWFIGSELELRWGSKRYLRFILFSYLMAGIFYFFILFIFFKNSTHFSTPFLGLSGICYALLISYAIIYKDRYLTFMLIFPMKARYFALLLVGLEVYLTLAPGYGKTSLGHLGAILFGFIYYNLIENAPKMPKIRKKKKNHLALVNDDGQNKADQTNPKYWQ